MSAGGNDYIVQWEAEWADQARRVWSYRVKSKRPVSAIKRSMEKICHELIGDPPEKLRVLCVKEELSPLNDWAIVP